MNSRIVAPVVALVAAGIILFFVFSPSETAPEAETAPGTHQTDEELVAPTPGAQGEPDAERPAPTRPHAGDGVSPADELDADLNSWRVLFEPRERLSHDEIVEVMKERDTHRERVIASIGRLPGSDIDHVRNTLAAAPNQEKLMLVRGLGANETPEAVAALNDAYDHIDVFRVREEVLRSLGNSNGPGRNELAIEVMFDDGTDTRLRMVAAQSLRGEEEALGKLEELMYSNAPIEVRLEAIHSIGGIGTEAAAEVLRKLIANPNTEERVRVFAVQELRRMAR